MRILILLLVFTQSTARVTTGSTRTTLVLENEHCVQETNAHYNIEAEVLCVPPTNHMVCDVIREIPIFKNGFD